jgi:nucleoside-diphosphate-sugar epimerase
MNNIKLNMKKIFILGGSGYIGSQIVEKLKNQYPKSFISVDKRNNSNLKQNVLINLNSRKKILKLLNRHKPNIIINCATHSALAYENKLQESVNEDLKSLLNIFEYLKENAKCKMIYFSSSYVYSGLNKKIVNENENLNPKHNFGIAKIFFENLIFKNHKNSIIFRLSSVFGKGKALIPNNIHNFVTECSKGKKLTIWGTGNRKIQYIFINDVVKYTIKCFSMKPGVYNLGGKKHMSIKKVSKIIAKFYNGSVIFKKKKERETLSFMNINKITRSTKNYPSNFYYSLNKYLSSFRSIT